MVRKGDEAKVSFETGIAALVRKRKEYNFIGNRKKAYLFSGTFILIGIIIIAVQGLNFGVDFKGGRSYIVSFNKPIEATAMRNALAANFENAGTEVKNYTTNSSTNMVKITTSYLVDDESDTADDKVKNALIGGVEKFTSLKFSENDATLDDQHFSISSSSKVGATIADDIKNSSVEASILALALIFVYILIRFKKWTYSTGAVIALFHDSLFVISSFAIAGLFGYSFEIDQVFIAALLTIIGYSINDTVIVYDRIREYLGFGASHDRKKIFNDAINNTLSRTLITSGTTLITVVVLLFFGGEVLRGFSFALFIGFTIGTYSSIFIAAPMVIDLEKEGQDKQLKPVAKAA
jgi:SecD/SecF fusion protein